MTHAEQVRLGIGDVARRPWTSDDWSTPVELVRHLALEYGPFDVDPCCRRETAKAPTFYTIDDDGLSQPWPGRVFVNPPYSGIRPWCEKALAAVRAEGELVVMLLPVSTDTAWFHECVLPFAELRFLRSRVRFIGYLGTPIRAPKAPSMLAIFRRDGQR